MNANHDPAPTRSVLVPPQRGRAVLVRAGDVVDVVDLEGEQVGDLWAIDAAAEHTWLSTAHTRDCLERLFPRVGESFTDQHYEPILEFTADTSAGAHDMLFPACNPALYAREGLAGHPNCADNFHSALADLGLRLPILPEPVNFFQNTPPGSDGALSVGSARSAPGDAVSLRALRDVVVVLTACAVDNWPTNGDRCTPLRLDVRRA